MTAEVTINKAERKEKKTAEVAINKVEKEKEKKTAKVTIMQQSREGKRKRQLGILTTKQRRQESKLVKRPFGNNRPIISISSGLLHSLNQ